MDSRKCRYRYQLGFFVDKFKGRQPRLWLTGEESAMNMRWIERIYEKVGLYVPLELRNWLDARVSFAADWSWESPEIELCPD